MNSSQEVGKKRIARSTQRQLNYLVDYMIGHSEFAAGRFCGQQGKEQQRSQWKRLTEELNKLGPMRECNLWQKTWTDLKCRARQKASNIAKGMKATGNKPVNDSLTDLEKKILAIIGGPSALGHAEVLDSMEEITVTLNKDTFEFEVFEAVDDTMENTEGTVDVEQEAMTGNSEQPAAEAVAQLATEAVEISPQLLHAAAMSTDVPGPSGVHSVVSTSGHAENDAMCTPQRTSPTSAASSGATKHFAQTKDLRRRRLDIAQQVRDQFAGLQERQIAVQELMATALNKMADNDRARLEQEKANMAVMSAVAAAVKQLAEAIRKDDP